MVLTIVGLAGCGAIDLGMESGSHGDSTSPIRYKVNSQKSKFDVNNVTLDFYYGCYGHFGHDGNTEPICHVLYFCDGLYSGELNQAGIGIYFDDYHNIDNRYFIKEISCDEFNSDEYSVTYHFMWVPKIKHHEAITVPAEVFARESGKFVFQIAAVNKLKGKDGYYVYGYPFVYVDYMFIDEQTILLSKPRDSFLG